MCAAPARQPPLRFDRCELRPTERSLRIDGEEVLLGGRAFDLLHTLARRRNQVVSHRELMDSVWPGMAIEPNNLQVQIWALRRLLGAHVIVTVARRGYRIGPEVIEAPPDEAFGTLLPRPDDAETVARVVAALEQHALVTVAAADAAAAHAHATAAARRWAERSRCAVWHVQAHDLHQPDALTERLLGRLSRRADVLVVADAHEAPDSVQGTADRLLHAGRGGRMLVVARRALKLQREHVVQAVATPAPRRSAASAAAASGGPGLRRRQR